METNSEEHNTEQGEAEILSKTPTINDNAVEGTYVCPDPDCSYQRPRTPKGFLSVRGHALKAHKLFLALDDNKDMYIARGGEVKPRIPSSPREDTTEKEEGFFEPRETVKEPFVRMPDVLASLWEHSRKFGLSKKGCDTFVEAMKTRDVDDLEEIENVLRDMRADEHTISLLCDNWARSRGIYTSRQRKYDRYGRRIDFDEEEQREDDRKASMADFEYAELIESKRRQINAETQRILNPHSSSDDGLHRENKELREKLDDEREKRHQAEREADKAELNAKLAVKGDTMEALAGRLDKGITRLGDGIESLVRGVIQTEFPEKAPEREKLFKNKEKGIFTLMPEEMQEN